MKPIDPELEYRKKRLKYAENTGDAKLIAYAKSKLRAVQQSIATAKAAAAYRLKVAEANKRR